MSENVVIPKAALQLLFSVIEQLPFKDIVPIIGKYEQIIKDAQEAEAQASKDA